MPQLEHIEAIEKRLWSAADNLRANSNYASNEYFLPVMGLVFLRHVYSRYLTVVCATRNPRLFAAVPLWNDNHSILNDVFIVDVESYSARRRPMVVLPTQPTPVRKTLTSLRCDRRSRA